MPHVDSKIPYKYGDWEMLRDLKEYPEMSKGAVKAIDKAIDKHGPMGYGRLVKVGNKTHLEHKRDHFGGSKPTFGPVETVSLGTTK